jgi:protein TonB
MLAYAAQNPRPAVRAGSPKALALIVVGHVALIAAVMAVKMDVVTIGPETPPRLIDIKPDPVEPVEPEPRTPTEPQTRPVTQPTFIDNRPPIVDMGQTSIELDTGPTIREIIPDLGTGVARVPEPPIHVPVKRGPQFATAADAVKPPYPNDKLRLEEEATLRLKLTIDARGRVVAVDPVGPADPSFLAAARRHILKAWRYKPATEDGVAVSTTTVINLSFRLEEA